MEVEITQTMTVDDDGKHYPACVANATEKSGCLCGNGDGCCSKGVLTDEETGNLLPPKRGTATVTIRADAIDAIDTIKDVMKKMASSGITLRDDENTEQPAVKEKHNPSAYVPGQPNWREE